MMIQTVPRGGAAASMARTNQVGTKNAAVDALRRFDLNCFPARNSGRSFWSRVAIGLAWEENRSGLSDQLSGGQPKKFAGVLVAATNQTFAR
ncbi:MAG: hypothetical protein IPI89_07650 [Propionivibrio sp.]|nr:hypothetical protein [Propionivibrio sp.]